jgi:hypothetical protein
MPDNSELANKHQRRIDAAKEHEAWIQHVKDSQIAAHLSDAALNLLYIALGNECWRTPCQTK